MIYFESSHQFIKPHFYSMMCLFQDNGFGVAIQSFLDFDMWDSFIYEDLH